MFEKVNPSHPDKVADRIAGTVVDIAYETQIDPKVAVEVLIGHGICHIIAETSAKLNKRKVIDAVHRIAGNLAVDLVIVPQDVHLARNQETSFRCGDNGIFKGVPVTAEQKMLSDIAKDIYEQFPYDGKYILNGEELTICQSNAISDSLRFQYPGAVVNPLGDWTGGTDVDTGATNRKLGSDIADSITGGGLHGKDLSKADVSVNIYAWLEAQRTGRPVELCCAIGDDTVDGIPYEDRKIDHTFYPVIYEADEGDDWTDPATWKKANPSLGITVAIDKVKDACESAKQNPGEENAFRQLRLNQWVKQAVRWMPMEKWDRCAFAANEDDLEGRICYGGLDLSSTTDITAFVLVFPPSDEDDKFIILPYFWIPEDNLDLRVRRDHVPYDVWERQGYLQTTEGNVVHYGYIEKFIERLGERFNIREIAFDRWGAVQMVQNLEGMGFTVVPFGQGFKDISPPTKELMKLVLEERIAHGGHPVLRWMMDNIFIRTDPAGNIKPDKEKSTEKIDGAVATIMALDRAIRCGNDTSASVYDNRGILFL